jgi:hypothetical protein
VDAIISNPHLHPQNTVIIFRYPHPNYVTFIRIHKVIAVIKYGYYPLYEYEVIDILNYYLNKDKLSLKIYV